VLAVVLGRLADKGQLDAARWEFFFRADTLRYLGGGLVQTLRLALISMVLALAAGTVLALGRLARRRLVNLAVAAWVQVFRGVPLILLILFALVGLPDLGLRLSFFGAAAVGLVAYNSAVLAEIIRAGILSLERGQREAALALGLTEGQAMRTVILPQAARRMIPALVNQLVTLLKDTALAGAVLPYEELLRRSQIAAQNVRGPAAELQAYLLAAIVFVAVNLCLSRLARRLEVRQQRRYRAGAISVSGVEDLTALDMETAV
ncbi:MAG: amino acid ABC transporter permease, partial [Acidimicrobiia bacterium]